MTKDLDLKRETYVRELAHARKRQIQRQQSQTFFYCKFTVQDEIEHAIKYNHWRLK